MHWSSSKWVTTTTAKSLQSCPTLCDPIDNSPPGFPVPGILQARTLEWVAISFSNAWTWKWSPLSRVRSVISQPHGMQPTRLVHPWDFPGKSTGVGCHRLIHSKWVNWVNWNLFLEPHLIVGETGKHSLALWQGIRGRGLGYQSPTSAINFPSKSLIWGKQMYKIIMTIK